MRRNHGWISCLFIAAFISLGGLSVQAQDESSGIGNTLKEAVEKEAATTNGTTGEADQATASDAIPLYDDDLIKMVRRLAINILFTSLVVYVAYRYGRSQSDFLFTFLLMNVMIFFICFALKKLQLELGMALGLFAIFGIIRYRTDAINVRDMTYLFVVIGLAVINALSNKKTSYAELIFANAFIVATTAFLEQLLPYEPTPQELKAMRQTQQFVCDDLELLKPENREQLTEHIYKRLGIRADRVVVKRIDVEAGRGNVTVHYRPEEQTDGS